MDNTFNDRKSSHKDCIGYRELLNLKQSFLLTKKDVENMITGLYGGLDKPNEGILPKMHKDISSIKDDQRSFKKGFWVLISVMISFTLMVGGVLLKSMF